MSIKHILHKLTCRHHLLRLLPGRYVLPSLSFIRNTTKQLLRHRLHIHNKRPMRLLHHTLFLSRSLNGSLKPGPLNLGPFNLHPSRQTWRIPQMQPARSQSLRPPMQRHDRMPLVHPIHHLLRIAAQRNAIPLPLGRLMHRLFKRARGGTRSHQSWLQVQLSILV